MEKVDLLIENAKFFNSYYKEFMEANISILDGKFYYIDYKKETKFDSKKTVNLEGKYIIPGLIDIHMHIESSMLTPEPFCNYIASRGVTTIVSEPHEIANVSGIDGVKEMIGAGEDSIIDVFYGIPSSVPSTDASLETTGGKIDFEDMKELSNHKNVICVGEVMNYREVIRENDLDITKFIKYIKEKDPSYIIEGHCPSLVDLDLAKFLYLGIDGDHTEHTLEEIEQRFKNGMFVEIQEKMIREEIISHVKENNLYEHMAFVTDDVMVDDLYKKGHLDNVIKKAIKADFPIEEAIYCSTYTPARRMNLRDRGVIAPGKIGDFIILDDLEEFKIDRVFKDGNEIYNKDEKIIKKEGNYKFPEEYFNTIKLDKLEEDDFKIKVDSKLDSVKVRVMVVNDGTTHLQEEIVTLPVEDGIVQWENSPYLLATVFERYGVDGSVGYGFITGDGIKRGAVGSTWVHDHHNLLVVGSDAKTIVEVGNTIIDQQGGFVVGENGKVLSNLPLPIGGIVTDRPIEEVSEKLDQVRDSLIQLGYDHYNPIMSVGTYGLVVSPHLKLTNKGLVHVAEGEIVDLIVN